MEYLSLFTINPAPANAHCCLQAPIANSRTVRRSGVVDTNGHQKVRQKASSRLLDMNLKGLSRQQTLASSKRRHTEAPCICLSSESKYHTSRMGTFLLFDHFGTPSYRYCTFTTCCTSFVLLHTPVVDLVCIPAGNTEPQLATCMHMQLVQGFLSLTHNKCRNTWSANRRLSMT